MKLGKVLLASVAVAAWIMMAPGTVCADTYDTDDSDHPLRYVIHPIHAYGKGIEYFVTRPIHWIVSQPKARYVFGHVSYPRTEDYWGDFNLYQRYSY
jgi:hypothetical protein